MIEKIKDKHPLLMSFVNDCELKGSNMICIHFTAKNKDKDK